MANLSRYIKRTFARTYTGLVPRDEHEPGVRGEDRLQQRQDPELQARRLYQEIQVMNDLDFDLYSTAIQLVD